MRTSVDPESSDYVGVEAAARDYIEGWYAGDVERMDRALHDELVKRVAGDDDPDSLRQVTKARMIALTTEGGGDNPEAEFEILVDGISDDIATARVVSPEYVDYLHLARTTRGWKIVNVLFRTRD